MEQIDPGLALAWQAFVEQGQITSTRVKPVIAESWTRSMNYGVSPHSINQNDILEAKVLKARQEAAQSLLETSTNAMESLHLTLKGLGFNVILTDSAGYILKSIGDSQFLDKAQRICLSTGANWSEHVKGTNAIGTALQEAVPVNVFAWEHYCKENHFIACSAAPIMGPNGELLGVLDITGDYRVGNDRLLHMVTMAAKNIEKDLVLNDLLGKYKISKQTNDVITEVVSDGLLTISTDGLIKAINPMATNLLGFKPQECIGKPVAEILSSQKFWMFNSHDFKGEVIVQGQGTKRLISRGQRIFDIDGKHISTVATLTPIVQPKEEKVQAQESHKPENHKIEGSNLRYSFDRILGSSNVLEQAIVRAKRASCSHSTILIQGETGTGKELFAQSIHNESPRKDGPFVAINCGAIPKELVESELFGYEEGAFTGARRGGSIGKFEAANNGTLFLDEIGDMPLMAQTALLRVLQEKQIIRVGGRKIIPINVRVIAATHRSLEQAVEQGTFRRDLYYRLNVIDIQIPSLRERGKDILQLADYFLEKYCTEMGRPKLRISPEVSQSLLAYYWPGNIRELENVMEGLANIVDTPIILTEHLPGTIQTHQPPAIMKEQPVISLKEMEKMAIVRALEDCKQNISSAAQVLGIGRNTLHRKLKEYKLQVG